MSTLDATEAERALLGACLSGWKHPDELDVRGKDFYHPRHEAVWNAITDLAEAGTMPDAASVAVALTGHAPPIDVVWVMDLVASAPMATNAPYYADQVRTASGLREIQRAGQKIHQIGSTMGDIDKAREEARQEIDQACRGNTATRALRIADLLEETLDLAQSGETGVLSTGWPDIDRAIGGIAPGRLIVFGARPGGGKSLAGTNLALHVAHRHGHAVLIASLEMGRNEVMNRMIAAHARVSLTHLTNGTVPESDWAKIASKHAELNELPIFIEDASSLTVQALRRRARDVQREREDLALIVVDYLQLMDPPPGRANTSRAEEISQISRGLKQLARETGACVVAMAQVNREGGKHDEGPRLTDIREGGAENDADVVILLHRPDPEGGDIKANVAKNRHGPMAMVDLEMWGHYAILGSRAWSPTRALGSAS